MARVKKGDTVFVRTGSDAGKRGRVLRVMPDRGLAVVEGISIKFKHLKKSQKHPQGGRVQRETPIYLSKLMPVDPKTDEPTRVSYRVVDGQKRRFARGTETALDGDTKARKTKKTDKADKTKPSRAKAEG